MGLPRNSRPGRYMQISICINASAAPRFAVVARSSQQDPWPSLSQVPVTGAFGGRWLAGTTEKDPDGDGFGV